MGTIATALVICCGLPAIALSLYMSYLVLMHIQATDLMWFIFIINIPVLIIGNIAAHIVRSD